MEEGPKVLRKSCDFCYLRKIKCDGQKPRCSHCITYMVNCTYAAPSRTSKSKKGISSRKIGEDTANLQARVQRLEAQLEQLAEHPGKVERQNVVQTLLQQRIPIPAIAMPRLRTSEDKDTEYGQNSSRSMDLPPLAQVLPLAHTFLEKFNSVLPLFHAETLLRLVHDFYYTAPQQQDPVAWAAINVVLALTYRQGLMGPSKTKYAIECLNRAQSVLSDLALGNIQLLNIQVLVGIVMLVQASQDLQPALILIATTIRLAHKIGLHSRTCSIHLNSILAKQRACVFWMAYILDKDLSLRSKQPSVQLDDDIDLSLPWPETEDRPTNAVPKTNGNSIGIIATADGTFQMNYFVARIQLAVIEGGVYDYLYSARSQKRDPGERLRALHSVARALEQWKASIPSQFNGAEALTRVSPDMIHFLCVLNATSLLCATSINQAHAWNVQWMTSLHRYGREGTVLSLPPQWEALVDEARDLMVVFGQSSVEDRWNFWITGCSYMTAMMLLTANSMHNPRHNLLLLDDQLVQAGMEMLNNMVEETKSEVLLSFQKTYAELHQYAQRRRGQGIMTAQ